MGRWPRFFLSFLMLFALAGGIRVSAQSESGVAPTQEPDDSPLEISANLVTVTVVVRDENGNLVTDLTPEDFVVYEDGKRQEIDQVFREGEVPLRLAFLFDASKSVRPRLAFEKRAAERFFLDALGPGDRFALYTISTDYKIAQPFTGSAGALVDSLAKIEADGMTALNDAVKAAAEDLAEGEGRRVIVALTDGYDTNSDATMSEALQAAQRADVVIYGISPAGAGDALTANEKVGAANLARFAEDTGGLAFFPPIQAKAWEEEQTLEAIYKRLVEELRAQMVITYYSTAAASPGTFRNLKVDVKRPGFTVSARKGFYER